MIQELVWEWVPWIYNRLINTLDKAKSLSNAIKRELFSDKKWVFMKGHTIPISQDNFSIDQIYASDIRWLATLEPPRLFLPTRTEKQKEKHISYLSFVVTLSTPLDDSSIDLSDWINDLKWSGVKEPSPLDIFSLWCCKNGSHLIYYASSIKVTLVTEEGQTIEKGLNDFTNTTVYEDVSRVEDDR
jgi:hypothetical protein